MWWPISGRTCNFKIICPNITYPTIYNFITMVRCEGLTKAGTRCKNVFTSIGTKYCHLHGPTTSLLSDEIPKEPDTCPICLIKDTEVRSTKACNHNFHPKCLEQWCKKKKNCPTCRTNLKSSSQRPVRRHPPQLPVRPPPQRIVRRHPPQRILRDITLPIEFVDSINTQISDITDTSNYIVEISYRIRRIGIN